MTHPNDRDERLIAEALRADRDALCAAADVPPATLVWCRASVRARSDAVRSVGRPLVTAQLIAVVCLIALGVGAVASTWQALPGVHHAIVVLIAAVAIGLLVAPVAVLAVSE